MPGGLGAEQLASSQSPCSPGRLVPWGWLVALLPVTQDLSILSLWEFGLFAQVWDFLFVDGVLPIPRVVGSDKTLVQSLV